MTIFLFTPLNAGLFPCLLDGNSANEHKALENGEGMNEALLDDKDKKKPAQNDETVEIDENDINAGFKDRGKLIDEKEFTCLLFFKRLDLFLLKPWLIRDYEKRQVKIVLIFWLNFIA